MSSVVAVAVVAHALVPSMPWAAAITLGAIVAPPDAVAATSVLRQLSPPYRLLVILEGESLLNDATALLIYRAALHALSGGFTAWSLVPVFLLGSLGSVAIGYAAARASMFLTARMAEGAVNVVMQFVGTFAVWILSDRVGVSPILATVVFAMTLSRMSHQGAEARVASFAVWDVAIYVLTALAFVLMGLQLKEIGRTAGENVSTLLVFSAGILVTVVVVRLGWVMIYSRLVRARRVKTAKDGNETRIMPTKRGSFIVGWCGMRGIVTLATALALPVEINGLPFPNRDLLVAAAFGVVLGTLVIQGLSLGPILRWSQLSDDGLVQREEVYARQEIARAALDALDGETRPEALILRKEYKFRVKEDFRAEETLRPHHFGRLRLRAIEAERQALSALRRDQKIGDAAFHTVQEELDWAEGHAAHRKRAFSAQAPAGEDVPDPPTDGEA